MKEEKNPITTGGFPFNPDPKNEIPLAASVIKQIAEEGILNGEVTPGELAMIRASAVRILAEMNCMRGGEAVIPRADGEPFLPIRSTTADEILSSDLVN